MKIGINDQKECGYASNIKRKKVNRGGNSKQIKLVNSLIYLIRLRLDHR